MTHLLDTNICSAHMRHPAGLAHRFFQYAGGIAISSVVLAELYAGAYKHPNPARLLALINDLLQEVSVLDFDSAWALLLRCAVCGPFSGPRTTRRSRRVMQGDFRILSPVHGVLGVRLEPLPSP